MDSGISLQWRAPDGVLETDYDYLAWRCGNKPKTNGGQIY